MLKTVDVLIGFTLIMLIMSMAVTLATQIITSMLESRGKCLKEGVGNLLRLLDRGLRDDEARQLADYLLRDSLVSGTMAGERRRLATAIHRDELTKLLLEVAIKDPTDLAAELQPMQTRLQTSLKANGIPNPQATLEGIRSTALQLEKTNPEMSNSERMNTAILHNAESDYVSKLNGWFDQTMDRVSENFTKETRRWTFLAAVLIALALQLDAVTIVNRLSVDDKLRNDLVKIAVQGYSDPESTTRPRPPGTAAPTPAAPATVRTPSSPAVAPPAAAAPNAPAAPAAPAVAPPNAPATPSVAAPSAPAAPVVPASSAPATSQANAGQSAGATGAPQPVTIADLKNQGFGDLLKTNLIELPGSISAWSENWWHVEPPASRCKPGQGTDTKASTPSQQDCVSKKQFNASKLIGVLISIALISFGAPFWYEMLKNLIRLRSLVASKDEAERNQRQTTQPAAPGRPGAAAATSASTPAGAAAASPATLAGERGDLAAMG